MDKIRGVARQRDHGRPGDEAREAGNRRSGYRERRLATGVGAINLRIPKLRAGECRYVNHSPTNEKK